MSVKISNLPVVSEQEPLDRAIMVEEAASRAIELVKHYSQVDPYNDDPNNPWRNPQDILQQLCLARAEVVSAWGITSSSSSTKKTLVVPKKISHDNFRAIYIGMITDAFAEELEAMRNSGKEELDVDVLVDCLQSGMDLLTHDEKVLMEQEQDDTLSSAGPTPHELRRKQLGFHF